MSSTSETVFEALVDDADTRKGLADKAKESEPANFTRHVAALSASKVADGLINPKLVLSWLLTHLGAGSVLIGLLVPVRESGALLPQIFTTPRIASSRIRKWFWAGGALGEGLAAAGIVVAGLTLEGPVAGAVIVGLLAILALARSVCSASYKDVLGKTVAVSHRGTATGLASSTASVGVIAFALLLMTGIADRFVLVIAAIAMAAALWMVAAAIFATLEEVPSDPQEPEGNPLRQFSALREDSQLTRFIVVRSMLVGTALAPPYLVMLQPDGALGALGALVLASAIASLLSSYVWGRLSDRSSRRVLIYSGIAAAGTLLLTLAASLTGAASWPLAVPVLLFGLMIAYHGVRQGRSTHLVDMAPEADRARYTAVSNTIVGLVLIAAGAVFAGISALSVPLVIALFAGFSLAAAWIARGLDEVQDGEDA